MAASKAPRSIRRADRLPKLCPAAMHIRMLDQTNLLETVKKMLKVQLIGASYTETMTTFPTGNLTSANAATGLATRKPT